MKKEQQRVDTPPAAAHNMSDYALESNGGSVMQKHSSKTYRAPSPYQSYLFYNIFWTDLRGPPSHRTVIQGNTDLRPGYCWAFAGGRGHLVVSLSHPVSVTHVTLDHISKTVSPTGQISEAPKNFAVFGMSSLDEAEGTWLGSFQYNQDGGAIQTFQLPESAKRVFKFVKLVVESNWGHEVYTCLYRFRVHGTLSQ
ncbi:SUN domain-containing protein 3-like [Myripristis murdjan]|uniref:SUN domain-containing protein 3-like n=1 Tax=Myripristis murdjan TaxID=586833 RepID=UPI00117649F1|nr:SUN domain-containing protein 3-like [Myripristis murdjan]